MRIIALWLTLVACVSVGLAQVPAPVVDEKLVAPVAIIQAALLDASTLPPEVAEYTRYLDLGNIPFAEREDWHKVLSGHVNQLSRFPLITPVRVVPNTFGSLVALRIGFYKWDKYLYGALVNEEPFYHIQLFDPETKKKTVVFAPWLTPDDNARKALETLVTLTQSNVPVIRADWFLNQTGAVNDRAPNYYDFVSGKLGGLKNTDDFKKLIGFDRKLADDAGGELRAAVSESGVSEEPRAIGRLPTVNGGFWFTWDFKKAQGQKNPLRNLGKAIDLQFDATEQYGHLPNSSFAVFLADDKGVAQGAAPGFVGKDRTSKSNDGQIHSIVSCIRCHGAGGLRGIDDWIRNMIAAPFSANVYSPHKGRKQSEQEEITFRLEYTRDLDKALNLDKARYEGFVVEATGGWDSKIFAQKFGEAWEYTENARVDIVRASRDIGYPVAVIDKALRLHTASGAGDAVISVWVQEKARIRTVRYRQWLESVPVLHEMIRRLNP